MFCRSALTCVLVLSMLAPIHAAEPATKTALGDPDAAPEIKATVPKDFVEHKTKDDGLTLMSPRSWKEDVLRTPDAKVNLLADDIGRSVNLVVVEAPKVQTLEGVVTKFPKEIGARVPGFKLLTADFVKLSGRPVARLVYEVHLKKGQVVRVCQFCLLKNNKQYILTYAAPAESYDALLETAEQVAVSLKVP